MRKLLLAVTLCAFIGGVSIAATTFSSDNTQTEVVDSDKKKEKKKKKNKKECAKECADKTSGEKASCTKAEKKACCSKSKEASCTKKASEEKKEEKK
ncbi:MAG: hypothetical protein AAF487_09470 [Bacteroidota bacterium]